MRRVMLAVALAVTLTGCDVVQGATDTVDKATLCIDAIKIAGFVPDLSNPQAAAEATRQKAEELGKLADKAADTSVKQAIEGVENTMSKVSVSDLDPSSAGSWLRAKAEQLAKLSAACA